jgi:hypothetical protein
MDLQTLYPGPLSRWREAKRSSTLAHSALLKMVMKVNGIQEGVFGEIKDQITVK